MQFYFYTLYCKQEIQQSSFPSTRLLLIKLLKIKKPLLVMWSGKRDGIFCCFYNIFQPHSQKGKRIPQSKSESQLAVVCSMLKQRNHCLHSPFTYQTQKYTERMFINIKIILKKILVHLSFLISKSSHDALKKNSFMDLKRQKSGKEILVSQKWQPDNQQK